MLKKIVTCTLCICMAMGLLTAQVMGTEVVTWDAGYKSEPILLSNGNLTAKVGGSSVLHDGVRATKSHNTGKWYWEVTLGTGSLYIFIGAQKESVAIDSWDFAYINAYNPAYGGIRNAAGELVEDIEKAKTGDIIGVALDMDLGTLIFYKNGKEIGQVNGLHTDVPYYASLAGRWEDNESYTTTNFGAKPFAYAIPQGYLSYDGSQGTAKPPVTYPTALRVLLNAGGSVQLSISKNVSDNSKYTWTSSNVDVVTVNSNGKVTAVGKGIAEVYAKNANGSFQEYIRILVIGTNE